MIIRPGRIAAGVAAAAVLAACSSGPATKAQVCAGFDALDTQLVRGNAGFGNPLFDAADDLGDLAQRYPGLAGDATALHAIADSSSTSADELRNATTHIQTLCDRPPLGLGTMFGSS